MIGNATRELFEPKAIQSVTIRSPISFAVLMIAPILPEMARSLPSIQLRIETIHTPTDYAERSDVLDIRFGNGSFAGRQADRLTRETLTPMAAPDLAKSLDWTQLPMLTVVGAREMYGEWFAAARMMPAIRPTHKFDSFVTALEAAKQGAGILLGSRPLADAALRDGHLVTLSDFALSSGTGHYLTAPSGAQLTRAEEDVRHWFALCCVIVWTIVNRIDTCCQQGHEQAGIPDLPDKSLKTRQTI
jgi:LysR family transcriptional regulator, regulator of gene expression of beta-lactamase